jgi:AAA15 family ATPase/GTPase
MIDSLHIQNYRLFKDLKIDKLGQVNLIAGKNNTGKTALLEAIRILKNNMRYEIIANILYMRDDLDKSKPFDSLISLFGSSEPSHAFSDSSNLKYTFKINELEWYIIDLNGVRIRIKDPVTKDSIILADSRNFSNYEYPNDETIYIPFKNNLDLNIKTNYWEKIEFNTYERQKVVDFLNIISPNKISQISISNGIVRLKLEDGSIEKLTKWGDGASRLLTIALALVNAKDKTLLIDEFEVGLHHSVQEQLWEIIFKYAKEWSIQVFVTTHSQDTIENFYYVANKYDDMGKYFVLSKVNDNIEAVNYDLKEMKLALETNLELR